MIRLGDLEKKYSFHSESDLITDIGQEADIYMIDGLAAKIWKSDDFVKTDPYFVERALNEYKISLEFFKNNISGPRPYGVYAVENERGEFLPAFVMEYLDDDYRMIENLFGIKYEKAEVLRNIEERKIRALGWRPIDIRFCRNSMYSSQKDDLKIFDFGRYYKRW